MIRAPLIRPVCSLFLFLSATSLHAQTRPLAEVIQQLRLVVVKQESWPSTDVPVAAQKLLPQMKAGLRKLVLQTLNQNPAAGPDTLRNSVLESLKAANVEVLSAKESENASNYEPNAERYGFVANFQVRQPARHPELLAVVFSLTIPCGVDDSFSIFRRNGAGWELALVSDSDGYSTVSGAQGWLKYAISPSDEEGRWFVVTASTTPWCTSNWQGLRYRVLRAGTVSEGTRVLLEENRGVYIGVDGPYRLTINPHGFEIKQMDSQSLDASLLTRVHVEKYEVAGDRVTRIPPLALLPQDFLDEWVNLTWEEASRWTSSADVDALRQWHSRLGASRRDEHLYTEFHFVQPCSSDPMPLVGRSA